MCQLALSWATSELAPYRRGGVRKCGSGTLIESSMWTTLPKRIAPVHRLLNLGS